MTDDFAYLNARIRVRRSQLLHEGFFSEALKLSFPEMVKVLGETIYGPDLTGDNLADVDRAVLVHLNRTVGDLPRLVAGEAHEAVNLILMRSDLANLKTILRGKRVGWSAEEILGHLGAGTIPRAFYGLLAEAADAAALAQLLPLQHPLARALRRAVAASREPLELEIVLDQGFYSAMLRRSRELDQPYLAHFIIFEIDALNLAAGLKLSTMGFTEQLQRFFLPGGQRVSFHLFESLAQGEVAALEELGNTDFGRVAEVRDLTSLERGLRCLLLTKAREGVKDTLGAGIPNDYVLQKEWEAGRIRLLARRAFFGLPSLMVEREVFCE